MSTLYQAITIMLRLSLLLVLLLSCYSTQAQNIAPNDSAEVVERQISSILNEKLKIVTTIVNGEKSNKNLKVLARFKASEQNNTPPIIIYVDVKQLTVDESQKVTAQVISIYSVAEISLDSENRLKSLEWANNWNSNFFPVTAQIISNKVVASTNIVTSVSNPVDQETVLSSFISTLKIWPSILNNLNKHELIMD